ncbi:hypothetical protein [uncultured Cloacibacillus sp.]|uniref:hypothetical protein n=1 Tax=uncultured Cloacibacillus sp. TaxID=889794 RepID=UPI0026DC8FBB|nr:hypothetical protein [uncultured Cloacibacillus sp.]
MRIATDDDEIYISYYACDYHCVNPWYYDKGYEIVTKIHPAEIEVLEFGGVEYRARYYRPGDCKDFTTNGKMYVVEDRTDPDEEFHRGHIIIEDEDGAAYMLADTEATVDSYTASEEDKDYYAQKREQFLASLNRTRY